MGKFLLSRIPAGYLQILPQSTVRLQLDCRQISRGNHAVEIDFNHFAAHVKSHIVETVAAMDDSGYNVFTGMLLHQIETAVIINYAFDLCSNFQRRIAQVYHSFSPFPYIQHGSTAQRTQIAGLSAALRIEGRCIQQNFITFFTFFATGNHCLKPAQMAVLIVQLSCHSHCTSFLFPLF